MRVVRVTPGAPLPEPPGALAGAVLARDVVIGGFAWSKGRRLDATDLALLARAGGHVRGPWGTTPGGTESRRITLLVPQAGDVHEDEAATRLAAAVAGPGLGRRGPSESRVDLLATHAGAVRVRTGLLARLDGIDGISIFTVLDGQLVGEGALVGSVKTGPHLVSEAVVARAEAAAARNGPVVEVRPYLPRRVAAVVKESLAPAARERFEAALRAKVEGLGSTVEEIVVVADDEPALADVLRRLARGHNRVDLVLTAGAASTDPADAVFGAFAAIGGRILSHGVPAHPGSMLWLGRAGRTVFLGLPTCGAYSKATAADILLPWLLAGEPASRRTVARLGHGGILTRDMRFRFPPGARDLEPPNE